MTAIFGESWLLAGVDVEVQQPGRDGKIARFMAHQTMLVEHVYWKLVMENARECYRCATGHPELALTFPVNASAYFNVDKEHSVGFNTRMKGLGLPIGPARRIGGRRRGSRLMPGRPR